MGGKGKSGTVSVMPAQRSGVQEFMKDSESDVNLFKQLQSFLGFEPQSAQSLSVKIPYFLLFHAIFVLDAGPVLLVTLSSHFLPSYLTCPLVFPK